MVNIHDKKTNSAPHLQPALLFFGAHGVLELHGHLVGCGDGRHILHTHTVMPASELFGLDWGAGMEITVATVWCAVRACVRLHTLSAAASD
jgi:hypothetical protein